jgi:hypothetical protein
VTYQPHQSEDMTLKPVAAVEFTPEEAQRGYAFRCGTKHYCCYGTYCDAGHNSDCRYATSSPQGGAAPLVGSPASDGAEHG